MKQTTIIILLIGITINGICQTGKSFDEAKEKAAILAVITCETEHFYKRDYEGWKKSYIQSDYAFQAWNNSDGTFDAKVGWPEVDEKIGNYIRSNPVAQGSASHPKVERRNMVWKFYNQDVAFLIWDQYNSDQLIKIYTHSKETRLMEKQNGLWKIVSVASYWDYKNTIPVESLK